VFFIENCIYLNMTEQIFPVTASPPVQELMVPTGGDVRTAHAQATEPVNRSVSKQEDQQMLR